MRRTSLANIHASTNLLSHSFGYDTVSGRLKTVSDGNNTGGYSYLANSPLVEYIYHTNGALRMTTQKAYDSVNRLTSIANSANGTTVSSRGYQYSSVNLRTAITNEDNSYWTNGYNARHEVTASKRHWSDHHPVAGQQYAFAYDGIGNRQTSWEGGNKSGGGLRESVYTANALNQYTQRLNPGAYDVIGKATNTATVTLNYRRAEWHDDYFHLLGTSNNESSPTYVEANIVGVLNGATTNDVDIVTTETRHLLLPPGTQTLQYDADGNLTNDCLWTYTWDAENRLTKMQSLTAVPWAARQKVEFTYDWQGRRIQKASYTSGAYVLTSKVLFLYDGWNPVAQLNATNKNVLQSYLWGLDLSGTGQGAGGVGGLLAINDAANGTHFAGYDGNGNVTVLVSATNSAVTAQYEYGPFGEPLCVYGAMAKINPFRFSTKYTDDETGMLYYGHRYYTPRMGNWPSRDPLDKKGPINLYNFISSNPINKYDILGLSERDVYNMTTNFLRTVLLMCDEGLRCDCGLKNNFLVWSPFHNNMGCADQADWMTTALFGPSVHFDADWTIKSYGREDLSNRIFVVPFLNATFSLVRGAQGPHHWGEAVSNDPDDPLIKYDPWRGILRVIYPVRTETYTIRCDPYMFTHTTTPAPNYWLGPLINETVNGN